MILFTISFLDNELPQKFQEMNIENPQSALISRLV